MRFPSSRHSMRRFRRAFYPRVIGAGVALAALGCSGAGDAVGPTTEPDLSTDAVSEAVSPAPDNIVATAGTPQRIAWVSYRNGGPDIYRMDPQGASVLPLTLGTAYDESPTWSYDNTRLAMVRNRPYSNTTTQDIYVINADGGSGHWVRPTAFPFRLYNPSWSPDGSRIVLTVGLNGGTYLAKMNTSTGDVSLINGPTGILGHFPVYDPTGQRIIFVGQGSKSVYQINADGTGKKLLFSATDLVGNLAISPDGKKIAFDQTVPAPSYRDIYVKNLVDGSLKRLTSATGIDQDPTWSSDGSKIAFTSQRTGTYQIYTIPSGGGTAVKITNTGKAEISPVWTH
jgi:Tol biopolymer transport system component